MKWTLCLLSAIAANAFNTGRAGPETDSSVAKRSSNIGLPGDGLYQNLVAVGFLPSSGDNGYTYTIAEINDRLALKPASTFGQYSQLDSLPYNDWQLSEVLDDAKSSGAVFQPAVMPTLSGGFSAVTSDVASEIATALELFTNDGITVWLRFAHEMNWYASDEGGNTYTGTSAEFITAWQNVYNAVSSNDMIKMWWSPNQASVADLQAWWPGEDYVDIVGVDCYPPSETIVSSQFDTCYQDFYQSFSAAYDLPFAIGETGAGIGQKEEWLQQLVGQNMTNWPNYVAVSWFEFDKEEDYRIVETDDTTLAQTQAIL